MLKFPKPTRRPKRKRKRDPKHLDFIRSLPCCVPGCRNPSEPHHLRTAANSGVGLKPDDRQTVSLCHFHHMRLHTIGTKSFEAETGLDLMEIARGLAVRPPPDLL